MSYFYRQQQAAREILAAFDPALLGRETIEKYNENHDSKTGQFTTGSGGGGHVDKHASALEKQARSMGISITDKQIGPVTLTDPPLTGINRYEEKQAALQVAVDPAKAISDYRKIAETNNGKIVNTDTAREIFPAYLADRTLAAAVHEPSSWVANNVLSENLNRQPGPGELNKVLLTAGGAGAGKTSGTDKLLPGYQDQAVTTLDAVQGNAAKAIAKVNTMLGAGKEVTYAYTYRDPVEALQNGVIKRAVKMESNFGSGRTVPVSEIAKGHIGAYNAAKAVADHFANDPRVRVVVIDNSRGPNKAVISDFNSLPDPNKIENLQQKMEHVVHKAREKGDISAKIYHGLLG